MSFLQLLPYFSLKVTLLRSKSNAGQIIRSSIEATPRQWQTRLHYIYLERDENLHRDSEGRVKSQDVGVFRTILVNGVPFDQLASSGEERNQKAKLEKSKRETPEAGAKLLRTQAEETASIVREVPKAFDFQLVGEKVVKGRPAYVLQATPHPGYHGQGKYASMFPNVAGKLWADKQDLGWIRVAGQVIHPFSVGLFLLRLLGGSQI